YVIYEPNNDYFKGKPKLSKVIYRPFTDALGVAAALEKKELNVGARLPATEYARLQKIDTLQFVDGKPPSYYGEHINTKQPYLSDKRIRQALMYALDRTTISKVLYGGSELVDTPIFLPKYGDPPDLKKYNFDPDKAKQLLKDAGWDPN